MNGLPTEVLALIFSELPLKKVILLLSVSKKVREASKIIIAKHFKGKAEEKGLVADDTFEGALAFMAFSKHYGYPDEDDSLVVSGKFPKGCLHSSIRIAQNLDHLLLQGVGLQKDAHLASLGNLTFLDISGNPIRKVEEIKSLSKLKYLKINYTKIRCLDFIPKMPNLFCLSCLGCAITSFKPLERCYDLVVHSGVRINKSSVYEGRVYFDFGPLKRYYCSSFSTSI